MKIGEALELSGKSLDAFQRISDATKLKEFAKLLGVSQATISKLEKGLVLPNPEILLRLSEISGKSIDWILKRDNDSV